MIVENTRQINASPDQVWRVTTDIEGWPRWLPTVTSVTRVGDGPFAVGSVAKIKQPGLPECEWRVTEMTQGVGFTWQTRVFGITMSATHKIVADEPGTKNFLRLELHGIPATLLWPVLRISLKKTLERENTALKTHCEAT